MTSPRSRLIDLIEQGIIPSEKIGDALTATKIAPDGRGWRTFIDNILLWLGGLAIASAVMFFIAYNWSGLGRFGKFGMVEGVIVLAVVVYCKLGDRTTASKVSLLVATICLGVLLALYFQTYQTGADPWQLFFAWALLMLPWAIIGRFPAIWILWIVLLNTAIVLYHQAFQEIFWFASDSISGMLWPAFILNTLLLAAWEFLAGTRQWLSERWAIRLLATGSGVSLTWLVLDAIFSVDDGGFLSGPAWVIWLAIMYIVYRKKRPDLFMLAGCCLSVITIVVSFLFEHILENAAGEAYLFLALLVIGMGAGAAFWLKRLHQEWQT